MKYPENGALREIIRGVKREAGEYETITVLAVALEERLDLLAEWENEGHIYTRVGDEWGLQHPPSCRPNLTECRFHKRISAGEGRDANYRGRYWLNDRDGALAFTRIPE